MLELRAGDATLTVDPGTGARWTSWRIGDLELLSGAEVPLPAHYRSGCFVMAPFAGRLDRGRLQLADGTVHQLPVQAPPHAIHGTVAGVPWRVVSADDRHAVLDVALEAPWPAAGSVEQRLALHADRLETELVVRAEDPMPATVGWHPWLARRLARGAAAQWQLTGGERYLRGDEGLPTGEVVPRDTGPWDDCFRGFTAPPAVLWPGALRLAVESSADHFVLFDEFHDVLCLEPQTAPPNAFGAQLVAGGAAGLRCTWRWTLQRSASSSGRMRS